MKASGKMHVKLFYNNNRFGKSTFDTGSFDSVERKRLCEKCACVCELVERLTENANLLGVRVSPGSLCSVGRGKGEKSDYISLVSNVYFRVLLLSFFPY